MKPIRAYHFVGDKLRDERAIPDDGEKLVFPHKPILCQQGLHASLHPFDALQYAPGNTLCLVECGGTILYQSDKLVCTERTIVKRFNAEKLMRYFAKQQALSVIHLWKPPQIVLDYLVSDTEELRDAARRGAWAATRDVARAAAQAAAWAATRDATWAAAWDVALAAARDATWAAAWDVARAAAQAAAWAATRDATWAAAWDVALAAARQQFLSLVEEQFA